jgi:hypothetical protein
MLCRGFPFLLLCFDAVSDNCFVHFLLFFYKHCLWCDGSFLYMKQYGVGVYHTLGIFAIDTGSIVPSQCPAAGRLSFSSFWPCRHFLLLFLFA